MTDRDRLIEAAAAFDAVVAERDAALDAEMMALNRLSKAESRIRALEETGDALAGDAEALLCSGEQAVAESMTRSIAAYRAVRGQEGT